jgi:hypothetical protein
MMDLLEFLWVYTQVPELLEKKDVCDMLYALNVFLKSRLVREGIPMLICSVKICN